MPTYTTEQKVKNYLQVTNLSSFASAAISDWIAAVSHWIDRYCNREFTAQTVTKLYDGNSKSEILTDDFTTLTKIEVIDSDGAVDESTSDSTDWFTYPANQKPKTRIKLNQETNNFRTSFPKGNQNIKVYADWGYETSVPKEVEMAATMMVAEIVQANSASEANVKSESLGDYSVTYEQTDQIADKIGAKQMLESFINYAI